MTLITLSPQELIELEWRIAHPALAKDVCRAQALLWLDEGETVQEVADRLDVTRQTVYNWATRFQARYDLTVEQRLADAQRSGRPRIAHGIIDPLIEAVIEQQPREFGYRSTVWTAPLLCHYLKKEHRIEVSDKSVSLAIARLDIRWKRPRYQLALRSATWRQAKGGSNAGSKSECEQLC
jgi:transposase